MDKSSTGRNNGQGKGENAASAGWQVTLCDPIWHAGSHRSAVLLAQTAIRFPLTFWAQDYWLSDWDRLYVYRLHGWQLWTIFFQSTNKQTNRQSHRHSWSPYPHTGYSQWLLPASLTNIKLIILQSKRTWLTCKFSSSVGSANVSVESWLSLSTEQHSKYNISSTLGKDSETDVAINDRHNGKGLRVGTILILFSRLLAW